MLADYHVHTYYSDDSQCPMEDMVQQGLRCGLDEIAFTEHVDYGIKTDLNCDYEKYLAEVGRLQKKYAGQITLRPGIEFGVQVETAAQFTADAARYPFDFIIMSNHQVGNKEFWTYEFQKGRTQEEYQTSYYAALLQMVHCFKDYNVLGHLDMIKRYDKCGDYPDEKIMDLVEPILRQVIADGKGIELNTSSFKYKLRDTMPSRAILQLYHELGGHILTIGSDTHETQHLADHFPEVRRLLREIGFNEFCTFQQRQPIFHRL